MIVTILHGDARQVMPMFPDNSVDCVVTSPPYWGLRDYGVAGQIGLEKSLGEHMDGLVGLFREVRRALKPTGTLWLNYGDAYASAPNGRSAADTKAAGNDDRTFRDKPISTIGSGLKPKDRMLLPARLAIALQEDGWWVRDEIIWHKPNPMPSSVKDRTTPAHEMIYLLSKAERYFFDHAAIKEPVAPSQRGRVRSDVIGGKSWKERQQHSKGGTYATGTKQRSSGGGEVGSTLALARQSGEREGRESESGETLPEGSEMARSHDRDSGNKAKYKVLGAPHRQLEGFNARWDASEAENDGRRARRSVWTVPPHPFKEAHFATFPPDLIRPCILAGCPVGGVVLDPFFGAGTVGLVAQETGRRAIGIELNADYIEIAKRRLGLDVKEAAE